MKTKLYYLLIASTLLLSLKSFSQTSIGGGFAYGSKISTIGINVTGQFFITEKIAVAPSFTYYFPNSVDLYVGYDRKWMEANVDANYYPDLNLIDGKLKPYGLAGVNYSIIDYDYNYNWVTGKYDDGKVSEIGINVGAGASFDIGKKILPFAQLKYSIINSYNQAQILVGIRYNL